jgi:putative ABC transport system ATP-binding protein
MKTEIDTNKNKNSVIETQGLVKNYGDGENLTKVLKGVDFIARKGEFLAIMGRSGAGKSTFLYQLSLLDDPTDGRVLVEEKEVHTMSQREKTRFRLNEFGYVFQDYALLPDLTAEETWSWACRWKISRPSRPACARGGSRWGATR